MATVGRSTLGSPGGKSFRVENKDTELWLPLYQALLRIGWDGAMTMLIVMWEAVLLGRVVIWLAVGFLLFTREKQAAVDWAVSHLYGGAAWLADTAAKVLTWGWVLFGLPLLWVVWPFTWGVSGGWHGLVCETLKPTADGLAMYGYWMLTVHPWVRLIALIVGVVPLFTWAPLRDRMKWSIHEITPYSPVDVSEQGIDPNKWGPQPEPKEPQADPETCVEFWVSGDDGGDNA